MSEKSRQDKGKGGKSKRRGPNAEITTEERKETGQEYAQVTRMLGSGHLEAQCFDGKTRVCHIRGRMRKKTWIAQGDIILIGLREFQDDKADVIHKYSADEARRLKAEGQIPDAAKLNTTDKMDDDDSCVFDFEAL